MTMISAEIAQAHDGSLGNALAFIDAVADVGADAVKFQCHDGDANNEWREGTTHPQDSSRFEYWRRTSLDGDGWQYVQQRAKRRGLKFGVSVFSDYAATIMRAMQPDFLKVPCHMDTSFVWGGDTPVIISRNFNSVQSLTGLNSCWWIHCSSERPCNPDDVRPKRFDDPTCVGLSSHCPEIQPTLDFVRFWCHPVKYIEHHVCWDRRQFGPDTSSSITIDELALLVKGVREIERERQ